MIDSDTVRDLIGNPIFAIETNLSPLIKRIKEGRTEEALEVVEEIRKSINKAKISLKAIQDTEEGIKKLCR